MDDIFEPLPKEKVEKGEVFVCTVRKFEDIKKLDVINDEQIDLFKEKIFLYLNNGNKIIVALLKLLPGAKIKYHLHTKDSEWYIPLNTDRIPATFCMKGEGHEIENTTNKVLDVLSIKIS